MAENEIQLEHLKGKEPPKITDFDDILEEVGSVARFQRILLYGVLFPVSVFESLFLLNLWFLLDEPNHWCSVPGREEGGMDLESWKNLTIPRNENGQFSKCEMFGPNQTQIPCQYGWDYDFSVANYSSILVDYNWVCDKSHYTTLVHTSTNAGKAMGTLIFGNLADKIGRKPVWIITLVLFSVVRVMSMGFANNIGVFVFLSLLVGMASPMFAISISTIALELSGKDYREWIYSFTWMILVVGSVMVPAVALLVPNWIFLGLITVSVGSISYLFISWIPESPRWLLSKGRIDEVVLILKKISRYNGTTGKITDEKMREVLMEIQKSQKKTGEQEQGHSALELFSRKRVAKHALLIIFNWIMNGLVFHGLNLIVFNVHGNRYFNFFLLLLMEVPGSFFGGVLSNKFGRRWMLVLFFFISGVSSVVSAYCTWVGTHEDDGDFVSYAIFVTSFNIAKFAGTMSFLVIYLQALELFPTPLRTTGSGLASTVSNATVILVPYLVYTGRSSALTPWICTAMFSFLGMTSSLFIPETKDQKLPETLDEADEMGKSQRFWSFRPPKKSRSSEE